MIITRRLSNTPPITGISFRFCGVCSLMKSVRNKDFLRVVAEGRQYVCKSCAGRANRAARAPAKKPIAAGKPLYVKMVSRISRLKGGEYPFTLNVEGKANTSSGSWFGFSSPAVSVAEAESILSEYLYTQKKWFEKGNPGRRVSVFLNGKKVEFASASA